MRPMKKAAPVVPFVLPTDVHAHAGPHRSAGRQIDIVSHQECVARLESHDEALVSRPVIVVGEVGLDRAADGHHLTRDAIREVLEDAMLFVDEDADSGVTAGARRI